VTGKHAPGIKKNVHARVRATLVKHDGHRLTAEDVAASAGLSKTTARVYLEWMHAHDEANVEREHVSAKRRVSRFYAV
jgi:response regulator of citrate/malate metabolism